MNILITGATGQLGSGIAAICAENQDNIFGISTKNCDISDGSAVSAAFAKHNPGIIYHCAAYTAVDKAEDEPQRCYAVNAQGTRNIAECAAKTGAKLVYVSTDYVFDGTIDGVYEVDNAANPQNVYGKSKLMGENIVRSTVENHFIVRTSWVFGNGGNFVRTMLKLGKVRESVTVVSDQTGSPTYAGDLAKLIVQMAQTDRYGTYHATNEGFCTWAGFAEEIFRMAGLPAKVVPVTTAEYGAKAKRPLNARLSKRKLIANGFERLPDWQDALGRYIAKEVER